MEKKEKPYLFISILLIQFLLLLTITSVVLVVNAQSNSPDSEVWYNKGNDLTKLGKFHEAIKAYDRAIGIDPNNSDAWNGKGFALNKLYKYDEALKASNKAIEINPNNSDGWSTKGRALAKLGKYDEALKASNKAIEINPQNSMGWTNKGLALSKLNRNDEAITAADKAIEINPQNSMAWNNKGDALRNLNQNDEAIKVYSHAIEISPHNFLAQGNLRNALRFTKTPNPNTPSPNTPSSNIPNPNTPGLSLSPAETPSQTYVQHTVKKNSVNVSNSNHDSPAPSQNPVETSSQTYVQTSSQIPNINTLIQTPSSTETEPTVTTQHQFTHGPMIGGTVSQDQQWYSAYSIDRPAVDSDISSLNAGVIEGLFSPENVERKVNNYRTYSYALLTDSQKAMDHSKSYTVSPELSSAKYAYETATENVNWAGFYAAQFATDTLSNKGEKANDDYTKTVNKINDYNKNIVETERLLKIYDQNKETKS